MTEMAEKTWLGQEIRSARNWDSQLKETLPSDDDLKGVSRIDLKGLVLMQFWPTKDNTNTQSFKLFFFSNVNVEGFFVRKTNWI